MNKCEYCKSEKIHINQRGFKLFSGFLGSSKLIATCLNCGYKRKVINSNSEYVKARKKIREDKTIKLFYALLIILFSIIILGILGRG